MITIVANFDVKPDCVDKFIRLAADCTRNTRKENGNLSYKVFQARNDKAKFTFIEEWLNDVAIDKHNEMPHFKLFLDQIAPLINGEPAIEQIMNVPAIR
ncbi:MAG: putative quinol monooxygenase [Candidatus Ornithomonoglobus sp.]